MHKKYWCIHRTEFEYSTNQIRIIIELNVAFQLGNIWV